MRLRTQDLLYVLAFLTPILLYFSYWAAEGFRTPVSQRYSLYLIQDPTLPLAVTVATAISAYLSIVEADAQDRRTAYFDSAAKWFFLPIYLTIVLLIVIWYRFDFSGLPLEGILTTLGRDIPGALSILFPALLVLGLGLLSLSDEQRFALLHSIVIVIGGFLVFGGAFFQFYLERSSSRLDVGYAGAATAAYVAMIAGAGLLFFSIRRYTRTEVAPSEDKGEKE